jgi:Flp pilus assembly protein TadB
VGTVAYVVQAFVAIVAIIVTAALVFTNTFTNIIASVRRITIADWVARVVQAFPTIATVIVHAASIGTATCEIIVIIANV